MFYSESLFSKFEKKSACRQFGFINQSVKDVTEIAGCRVGDGGGGREKTADGNISQLAEAKLPSVSVYEFRNGGCARASTPVHGCLSELKLVFSPNEVCIYTILWQHLSIFFASSEISEWRVTGFLGRVK